MANESLFESAVVHIRDVLLERLEQLFPDAPQRSIESLRNAAHSGELGGFVQRNSRALSSNLELDVSVNDAAYIVAFAYLYPHLRARSNRERSFDSIDPAVIAELCVDANDGDDEASDGEPADTKRKASRDRRRATLASANLRPKQREVADGLVMLLIEVCKRPELIDQLVHNGGPNWNGQTKALANLHKSAATKTLKRTVSNLRAVENADG
ncbi:MAG: hypothetical protein CHACPFDD_02122 [Phycisphaerae bacterium]|nr:hypothetical protein [Phycisphaerae bacterium]